MGLYEKLEEYVATGMMPMHMPGHKRDERFVMKNPYEIDITEVRGMDDLHEPRGVIRELMDVCREFYGTKETYLLVNGSTSGNLTAIASCCPRGSRIFVDEVCHRSVAHAVDILGLEQVTIKRERYGVALGDADEVNKNVARDIPGSISAEDVRDALKRADEEGKLPSAVIVTSPTYEGVVSDIAEIAEVVHGYDIPLIVDEAHGAHLTLAKKAGELSLDWPAPAMDLGADLVIESLHKTLPSLTQTALLHRCSDIVSDEKLMYYHDVFVTSSPSYVLMSSIDRCMEWQMRDGEDEFRQYDGELARIHTPKDRDPSKIILMSEGISGSEIADELRAKKIEPELVKDSYAVLMTSPVDSRRLPDLNRRIRELQSHALPLG